ncbi:MAG: hypothetical protein O2794_02755 [bacterium]|nr:hypothetical protein [bacterium]
MEETTQAQIDQETAYSADLLRERRRDQKKSKKTSVANTDSSNSIPLTGAGIFAAAIFIFFDLPQYIVTFVVGFFTAGILFWLALIINASIATVGWTVVYLWLIGKDRNPFSIKTGELKWAGTSAILDMVPLVPGISGYIITLIIRDRIKSHVPTNNKK